MNPVIDLDDAARAIASLRAAWTDGRMRFGPITWRDERDEFGEGPFEERRSLVADPFSLAVQLFGSDGDQVGGVVLFRGGWAGCGFWRIEDASVDVATVGAVRVLLEDVLGTLARN